QSRDELLRHLEIWCAEQSRVSVRLITGQGGQGKTRLARELCRHMSLRGWLAGMLRTTLTDTALEALQPTSFPCLLVVDYAETRIDQTAQLLRTVVQNDRVGFTRVLLLARAAGDWWTNLRA